MLDDSFSIYQDGGDSMARHSGGAIGRAGRILASKSSSKKSKSKAGRDLNIHKQQYH